MEGESSSDGSKCGYDESKKGALSEDFVRGLHGFAIWHSFPRAVSRTATAPFHSFFE